MGRDDGSCDLATSEGQSVPLKWVEIVSFKNKQKCTVVWNCYGLAFFIPEVENKQGGISLTFAVYLMHWQT